MKTGYPHALVLMSLVGAVFLRTAQGEEPTKAQDDSIPELIRLLGSGNFKEREAAHRKLLMRKGAGPALRKAAEAPDLELARRAKLILDEKLRRQMGHWPERLRSLAQSGAVDQLTELVARWPKGQEQKDCWPTVFEFAKAVYALNEKEHGRPTLAFLTPPGLAKMGFLTATKLTRVPHEAPVFFARAAHTHLDRPAGGFIFCTGRCYLKEAASCTVLALGPIEVDFASNSVFISDQDVKLMGGVTQVLVISRGTVTLDGAIFHSGIFGRDRIFTDRADFIKSTVNRHLPLALGKFPKFFELTEAGIEVVAEKRVLRIDKVSDSKLFARAGLQADDLIKAVDEEPVKSVEDLRRRLRQAAALGDEVVLHVWRSGKTLDLVVDFH